MTDFIEIETDQEDQEQDQYRFVDEVLLIGAFYELWALTLQTKDWVAYSKMITEFPSEWMDIAPVSSLCEDESEVPAELIMYPEGVEDESKRQELRAVLIPDEYAISSWMSERVSRKEIKKE